MRPEQNNIATTTSHIVMFVVDLKGVMPCFVVKMSFIAVV